MEEEEEEEEEGEEEMWVVVGEDERVAARKADAAGRENEVARRDEVTAAREADLTELALLFDSEALLRITLLLSNAFDRLVNLLAAALYLLALALLIGDDIDAARLLEAASWSKRECTRDSLLGARDLELLAAALLGELDFCCAGGSGRRAAVWAAATVEGLAGWATTPARAERSARAAAAGVRFRKAGGLLVPRGSGVPGARGE